MSIALKNKFITCWLLILFITPMLGAGIMYFTGKGIPHKTVHHGTLINPPLAFKTLTLSDLAHTESQHSPKLDAKWLLVYVNPLACEQQCLATLYKIRQTHTALNKDSQRLLRVLLTTSPLPDQLQQQINQTYPGTQLYSVSDAVLSAFLTNSPFRTEALSTGRLYIVDPLGNVMMTYPLDIGFEPLLSDLKRLLQLSQIG